MLKRAISAILFLFSLSASAAYAASAPDWLRTAAQQPPKQYADDTNAVMLLDDQETTVREKGDIVTHERIAYRILRPEGRQYAQFQLPFDGETKIIYLRGWSITAKGQEYEARDKDALEHSLGGHNEFVDEKEKILILPGAEVGTVVGFEYEHKRRPYLFQDSWDFQEQVPIERSRYTLHLPSNWEYRADWINHSEKQPVEQGGAYIWELTDIARIEKEYREPPYRALAGMMIVTFFSEKIKEQTYRTWNDLGLWYSQLVSGVREPSPDLQKRVHELAPASLLPYERIKALARFAQHDVRYFAIEVGIGGYRPHPAAEILAHRYGDCKDKATVLSSMLAQIGVQSFYMPIHDKRGIYTEKTPPNHNFNHVILAIQLPDASFSKPLPAIYEHPKLGHLLIFDPTNEWVPLGQLPYYEQDSYALLVTDGGGELVHLPVSSPELNKINRTARVRLMPDGTLQGEIEEIRSGSAAMLGRLYLQSQSKNDPEKTLEHFWGSALDNFQIDSFVLENADDIDKDLVIRYKFRAEHYAKNAGPLLLVRPHVVGEMAGYFDATKPRHYAYEIDAPFLQIENVEIELPEGYKVDELPEQARTTVPFAEYTSKMEDGGNVLKYSREYRMRITQVPVEQIDQLKSLFREINADEKSMAVLKRAN
jgi:Domain of Unknown Function with PDB structure (DUF3857)